MTLRSKRLDDQTTRDLAKKMAADRGGRINFCYLTEEIPNNLKGFRELGMERDPTNSDPGYFVVAIFGPKTDVGKNGLP